MIPANELRRGNLFHRILRHTEIHLPDLSTVFQVVAMPFEHVQAVRLGENPAQVARWDEIKYFDLSPIPLTQEWLHRFGGKINAETGVWRFSWGDNGDVFVFLHQGHDKYAFELGVGLCKPVEFVHQFQNFFFAFTETELEIKQ